MDSTADPGRRAFLRRTGHMVTARWRPAPCSAPRPGVQPIRHMAYSAPGHHRAKAKRVIYLFAGRRSSQIELFDYKPELVKRQPAGDAAIRDGHSPGSRTCHPIRARSRS